MKAGDLSQMSMLELFRLDAQGQLQALTAGLLALERTPQAQDQLEICMRAAHSLKGAARIVGLHAAVKMTHAMEDCFVAAQLGTVKLQQPQVDVLLQGVDLLTRMSGSTEAQAAAWADEQQAEVTAFLAALSTSLLREADSSATGKPPQISRATPAGEPLSGGAAQVVPATAASETVDVEQRVLRVTAGNLNRLLGLAGESLVASRWLRPYSESMLRLKRAQERVAKSLDTLHEALPALSANARAERALLEARQGLQECHRSLSQRLIDIDMFDGRSTDLAHRLYDSVLDCRMRPFVDGIRALPRTVRDLARSLGKEVRLEIIGEGTQVDRDILDKLDAPLGHLLRNAIDHGIESVQERLSAGKPAEGVVRLEARHTAGILQLSLCDDGRGIDLDQLKHAIVERKLTTLEIAQRLSEAELLDFLFLPGFSMKATVTEISGRGVGLDAVHNMIKQVRGTIRISTSAGKGTCFQLQLPLTLSVVRTLLVEIGGEPYAVPLAHIVRTVKLVRDKVEVMEGRQYFRFDGRAVGLVHAQQILGGRESSSAGEELCVLIMGDLLNPYGLITDQFLGECELVVQPLDVRFGKVKDIAAGALMEDGSPVLIIDAEDLLHSIERLAGVGHLVKVEHAQGAQGRPVVKRILVAEDSLTVRELERKLLDHAGYEVEVAVDGLDAWNMVRSHDFDLLLTDIDMPRMDGIELVSLIKKDPKLNSLPVMIVSYKDREEDRHRGLDAGADYYLTKSSFHDDTLLHAVIDLIGEALP
jgi:two-component system sensor histidine kinase and response regulator WspE